MSRRTLDIKFEAFVVDKPRRGWCSSCNLPSLIEIGFVVADARTLVSGPRRTVVFCTDCGRLWEGGREL